MKQDLSCKVEMKNQPSDRLKRIGSLITILALLIGAQGPVTAAPSGTQIWFSLGDDLEVGGTVAHPEFLRLFNQPSSWQTGLKRGIDLDYAVIDEPLFFGHDYSGKNACQLSISKVVDSVVEHAKMICT